MGDMEMIDKWGVKAIFTDEGVKIDLVRKDECCVACNDPRLLGQGNFKTCIGCGCRQ